MHSTYTITSMNTPTYNGKMKITKVDMKPVEVRWKCPEKKCIGYMQFIGSAYTRIITEFTHECTVCKVQYNVSEKFPRIEYELA